MVYNIDMRISRILEKDQAAAVIDRFLPGMRAKVEGQPAVAGMTLRKLAEYAKGAILEKVLAAINTELGKIELDREETAEEMAEQLINQPLTKEAAEQISVGEAGRGGTNRARGFRLMAAHYYMRMGLITGMARTRTAQMVSAISGPGESEPMRPGICITGRIRG